MWTNFFYNNYNNISDDEGSEDYFTADETEDIQCQLFDFVTWLSDDGTVWILPADFFNNNISLHSHHIFFALMFCVWFYQNNTITKYLFFISLGILIQGFSNYKYDGLITFYLNNTKIQCENSIIYKDKVTYQTIYKCEKEFDLEEEYLCNLCYDICA